jgi:hypothetical protein
LLTLKVRDRWGFSPLARQTRLTMEGLVPSASASVRVLQWVALAGFWRVVISTILAASSSRAFGGRPPRGASFRMPAIPRAANLMRQRATVARVMPSSAAMS